MDLEWRRVNYAIKKEAILSINLGSHEIEGFDDTISVIFIARKGRLTKEKVFASQSLDKVDKYLIYRKVKAYFSR